MECYDETYNLTKPDILCQKFDILLFFIKETLIKKDKKIKPLSTRLIV